jgi:hypothetical protein
MRMALPARTTFYSRHDPCSMFADVIAATKKAGHDPAFVFVADTRAGATLRFTGAEIIM